MSTKIILPTSGPSLIKNDPFSVNGVLEEDASVSGGSVYGLFDDKDNSIPATKKKIGEDKEFFLNIEFFAGSPKIKGIEILNDEGVVEKKTKSDDLLNIFIPVGRLNENKSKYGDSFIHSNLVLEKKGKELPMSGFFQEENSRLNGFAAYDLDGFLKVFNNQDLEMSEGDFLYLDFRGRITYVEGEGESFSLENLSVNVGPQKEPETETSGYSKTVENSARSLNEYEMSFSHPIGAIVNGNFLTFCRGNVTLSLSVNSISYYDGEAEYTSEAGCVYSNVRTDYTYSIRPVFS